ncbi:efflux RND transporter periplasmic adaptor subunit [Peristeroidobacter soli]|uniref:efflux RND transporter periplasmic adaptor subunit n=1 Tax=Peristeroidobacter soli TaxID=2497877 RepID=UPI001C3797B1|nr:efflux RND transporter periplasmic adaptor subunit [Peristeroidobacter soli]
MSKSLMRPVFVSLAALAALGALGYGGSKLFASTTESAYITAEARVEDLELTILASGLIEPIKLVNVGAQVSGQLRKLEVKVGDRVEAGQLIGQIDSLPQQNKLRNAEAALGNVRAQRLARLAALKQAELVYERQTNMLAADATPREEFEAAEAALETTRAEIHALDAQIRQAEITVDIAKVDLGYTRITAPISGVVVAVVTEEGRTVNANQSAPTIVMIAKLDVMRVKAEISEADVTRVRTGQKVYFTTLGEPDKRFRSTLRTVEPAPAAIASQAAGSSSASAAQTAATASAVYYNGLFEMPNPDGELRPSMTAQVSIVLEEAPGALVIPATALGKKTPSGLYKIRVLDGTGRAVSKEIKVGLNNNISAQVLEGLQPGEHVVVGDSAGAAPSGRAR